MSSVLFGHSYFLRFDPKLHHLMQPYPPLGTLIAAAVARDAGYPVALFDAMLASSPADWDAALETHRPRVAVLYEDNFNYLSKMCLLRMREAAFEMLAAARRRGCRTVVCGSDASDRPGAYLDHGADVVIVGEGEETLLDVLGQMVKEAPGALTDIAGTVSQPADGATVVRTPARPVIRDLDRMPLPAWDLVDVERYRTLWRERHGYHAMNVVTTRGCPFHCNWCAKPIWGQTYNVRSPQSVAEEVALLGSTYGPDRLWFADDILGLEPGWMARYADALEARDARIPFKCQTRADLLVRDGEVASFARAGAHTVWIGAESGSQRVLDAMEKGTTVEQIREATRRLHAAGVGVGFFLQFGYPGERRADIDATRKMVRDCRPDEIGISVSYPLPGTTFHDRVRAQLGTKQNWVDSDDLDMMFVGSYSTAFYRQLYRVVHKEFRARTAGRLFLTGPHRSMMGRARLAAAAAYHGATWPFARMSLGPLSRVPATVAASPQAELSHRQAATPTPQDRT